ncbi:alanine racemase [uncultured Corynebacterium sp.]|uniref:alanine racemase n=1 Tax=uncultured Corynebacterium sp. TaxID=159447 RepID=UPI002594BD30|nr:alanine racemase [uncultured Corynebacterium sp.]
MNLLATRIDLDAIARNTRTMKDLVGGARLMCVVKADAYNHGVERVVPVMERAGADAFAVATFEEARTVRALTDLPVLAWLWAPGQDIPEGIEVAAPSIAHLRALADAPAAPRVHLKVDTGMNRAGIDEEDWDEAFSFARRAGLDVVGVMSHLACADEPGQDYNDVQAVTFRRAIECARGHGLAVETNHLSNSPASLTRPDLRFEQVRAGVALYGLEPVEGADNGLRPAMSWVATVLAVRRVAAGEGVSYGLTWQAPADGYTAVISAGYADGLPRAWQERFEVGISGARYPQVGRVCMDQFIVWLGENPRGVAPGEEAVIFGAGGVGATELAARVGTINYEVVCSPAGRTAREYVGGGGDSGDSAAGAGADREEEK